MDIFEKSQEVMESAINGQLKQAVEQLLRSEEYEGCFDAKDVINHIAYEEKQYDIALKISLKVWDK